MILMETEVSLLEVQRPYVAEEVQQDSYIVEQRTHGAGAVKEQDDEAQRVVAEQYRLLKIAQPKERKAVMMEQTETTQMDVTIAVRTQQTEYVVR